MERVAVNVETEAGAAHRYDSSAGIGEPALEWRRTC